MKMKRIGVLALQGAFREHIEKLQTLPDVKAFKVRRIEELDQADGLILPGGESTVMGKLLRELGLLEPLRQKIKEGFPVWGTCAGMILLARYIEGQERTYLAAMDARVRRNAYGSQLDSFSAEAALPFLDGEGHPLVFIRAPYITAAGPSVDILAELGGHIIAAREKNMLATSFHPELTHDLGMYHYFSDHMVH